MAPMQNNAFRADDVLLTPNDAGRILGITPEAVRALDNRGHLLALKTLSGRRLFRRSDVERLALERAAKMNGNGRARSSET